MLLFPAKQLPLLKSKNTSNLGIDQDLRKLTVKPTSVGANGIRPLYI
ncbi:hypothetical protein [Okeania sp. SIO2B3]|nr:hypothetical protein [Okeania sp. SIO2B3]NET41202.1 hypothetical protein [Okeania sp. SIO2B3]